MCYFQFRVEIADAVGKEFIEWSKIPIIVKIAVIETKGIRTGEMIVKGRSIIVVIPEYINAE